MTWKEKMNEYGKAKIPFLFIIDFLKKNPLVLTFDEVKEQGIFFQTPYQNRLPSKPYHLDKKFIFKSSPLSYADFSIAFNQIQQELQTGNTYLCNLTFATPVVCNLALEEIFIHSQAAYKILLPNHFVCFSPECFVQIQQNTILTYPMKGTIDAAVENAEQKILNNKKEEAEHATIVDLLRNDLGKVAHEISVNQYRYIQKIKTHHNELLQISSEIKGTLLPAYQNNFGDLFDSLLPAGSISGAPKEKTVRIISAVEKRERDFYTGVFGVFDGQNIDSAVMIRFIEKKGDHLLYQSGAGITTKSNPQEEYQEIIQKIYVPIY